MSENIQEILDLVKDVDDYYKSDKKQETFNLLLLGEKGSGKSYSARTCRKPVHIDSFDPGGTKNLKPWIEKGEIIVDTRYESENPNKPTAYAEWKKNWTKRLKAGYFDYIGTYILDTSTTFSDAIINWVMAKDGLAGSVPRFTKDYQPQKIELRNRIKEMCDLPCDFIMTGHLTSNKDEVSGKITNRFMTTGQGTVIIPQLFDELYVATTKLKGSEVQYYFLTARTGSDLAATRIGTGKFDLYEKPDIKYLLKKAGLPYEDKPLFKDLIKGGDVTK